MISKLLTIATVFSLGAALGACGGDGGGGGGTVGTTSPPPPAPPPKFETQFGSNFAADFQASNNSEPHDVAAGDVIPVSQTAEPVPLPST